MRAKSWQPELPSIDCIDVWPPGRCTDAAMRAYRQAERERLVRIRRVDVSPNTGRTLVGYLSAVPQPWALERLGQIKRQIEQSGEQMRLEE